MFNKKKKNAQFEELKKDLADMQALHRNVMKRVKLLEEATIRLTNRLTEETRKREEEPPKQDTDKLTPQQIINEYFYFKEEQMSNGAR